MNRQLRVFFRVLLGCGASIFALAANSQLDQRPYQQWTADEVEKVLSESPWAQTHDLGVISNPAVSQNVITLGSVTVRLRSALPMRQALVRLRQLKSKYDKMSDRDKASLDEKNKPLLECPACADNYVVTLSPGPKSAGGVPVILQTMTLAEAKLNVHIFDELGQKRELVHFVPPKVRGEDAVFFFPRFNEKGQPLLTPQSKKLTVFVGPKILSGPSAKTAFAFDVSRMILNGNVAF